MCTVSYVPPDGKGGFILTSSRDERVYRKTHAPRVHTIGGVKLCFPKDARAGGSWIAVSEKGRLASLLNGGFIPHQKRAFHTRSRGRVLVDLVASGQAPMIFFSQRDLTRTEPFTVVTIDLEKGEIFSFTELTWDGSKKYLKKLDPLRPYLWSSVTIYSGTDREMKNNWFRQFLSEPGMRVTPERVIQFHSGKYVSVEHAGLFMRQGEELKTVSITQLNPGNGSVSMKYLDLVEGMEYLHKV